MDFEVEKKEAALADFNCKVHEMYGLFRKILKLNVDVYEQLETDLITIPVRGWRSRGNAADESQFFHAFILSSTDWNDSPNLDLPEGLVSKHLNEVAMPTLKRALENLQKTPPK
jgi:hypothetical protein